MSRDHEADPAILQSDPLKRLDAIIRRHGGKPKADALPSRMTLPPVGRRDCKGQLPLFPTVREARDAAEVPDEA